MAKLIKNPNDFKEVIINGCLIKPNTKYEIVPRKPVVGSVPDEYIELKSTKERAFGVGNMISLCQYNTGFNTDSENFNEDVEAMNDWSVRLRKSKQYYETFAEPLRIYIPDIERIKISSDNEFFDRMYENEMGYFSFNIEEGIVLDTANPIDRFRLYTAIIENQLVMKGKRTADEKLLGMSDESDPKRLTPQYAYVSISDKKDKENNEAYENIKISHNFISLLETNRDVLLSILNYIGVPASDKSTNAELAVVYTNYIEGNFEKTEMFKKMLNRYDDEKENLIKEFSILKTLNTEKGRKVLSKVGNSYFLGDTPLGSNFKSVAKKLVDDEELYNEFNFKLQE